MRRNKRKGILFSFVLVMLAFCLIQASAAECGDVNSNGEVTITDALVIAQVYVDLNPENYDPTVADVNNSGDVTISDALLVAQYYVKLIDALDCGGPTDPPDPTDVPPDESTYELQAEEETWSSGGVDDNHAGYTGSGFVNVDNASGEWIEWNFEIVADSTATITCVFRYASTDTRSMDFIVNDSTIENLTFAGSGGWDSWAEQTASTQSINGGSVTIRLTATTNGGPPNMDKMDITVRGGTIEGPTPIPTPEPTEEPTETPEPTPCDGTCPPRPSTLPKHWHEVNGFADTIGGLAGSVYKVTNTNSSGAGSLSDALSSGNRLIVFEVGGVFNTDMDPENNTTVAGQTAPYPGVTCIGRLNMRGNNIVISHVAVQYDGGGDAGSASGSNNVLDHSSVYWGKDETLTFEGGSNITLYKSICAEGLQFTGHSDGEHSKGIFMKNPRDVSIISSLVVNNALRNPRVDDGSCFLGNHVVYNHGPGWDHQGPEVSDDSGLTLDKCPHCFTKVVSAHYGTVTMVGSISLAGPESSPRAKYFLDGHNSTATGYIMDNIIKDIDGNDLFQANTEGEFTGGADGEDGAVTLVDTPPLWPEGYVPLPAHEALYEVLRTVGPHPGDRNYHAKRLLENVANGDGEIIDSPNEVGGYADYPTSERRPLTVPDGVEARQEWLDAMEDEIAIDTNLDLSRLYNELGIGTEESDIYRP